MKQESETKVHIFGVMQFAGDEFANMIGTEYLSVDMIQTLVEQRGLQLAEPTQVNIPEELVEKLTGLQLEHYEITDSDGSFVAGYDVIIGDTDQISQFNQIVSDWQAQQPQ